MSLRALIAACLVGVTLAIATSSKPVVPPAPPLAAPQQPMPNLLDYKFLPQAKGIAEIAPQWRQLNKMGSCVHCSTANCLQYMGLHQEAIEWRKTYVGGESPGPHLQKLEKSGLKFVMTTGKDSAKEFIDWIIATRRCAGVADKPMHCRNFCGTVIRDGKVYAVILDNNPPLKPHLEPFDSWYKGWVGQGAWGFTIVSGQIPPPVPTE